MNRTVKKILLLGVAVALSGCTVAYQPPLDVPAAPYVFASAPAASEPIRVEDATAPDTVITSRGGNFTFNNKLAQYGDAVVASLERELEKQGFKLEPAAARVIRIDVIDVEMAYPKKYRCDINLKVGVGGKEIGIATDSPASISHSDAIDASVADAVRRIMGHEDVVAYLTDKP
jgi:hypothetical protein